MVKEILFGLFNIIMTLAFVMIYTYSFLFVINKSFGLIGRLIHKVTRW